MNKNSKTQDRNIYSLLAKEILEYRLGIETSDRNIRLLALYLKQFEETCRQQQEYSYE